MSNTVSLMCPNCGVNATAAVAEDAADGATVHCSACGGQLATFEQLHAQVAREGLGLGTDDLTDDHVPVGGYPFGETT